jgi:hypothetical protein
VLFVPLVLPAAAVTRTVTLAPAPWAIVREFGVTVEGVVKLVLFESIADKLNVALGQLTESLFVILNV